MDLMITGIIVLCALIYLVYYYFVSRDCGCGSDGGEKKEKTHQCCGKCHEHSDKTNNFI